MNPNLSPAAEDFYAKVFIKVGLPLRTAFNDLGNVAVTSQINLSDNTTLKIIADPSDKTIEMSSLKVSFIGKLSRNFSIAKLRPRFRNPSDRDYQILSAGLEKNKLTFKPKRQPRPKVMDNDCNPPLPGQ